MLSVTCVPESSEFVDGVATQDVSLLEAPPLWVRIFLPKAAHSHPVPVVLYAHGGAYSMGDPSWFGFHDFCRSMAFKSSSIWISLSYRLAPAHRLPAAYDDGFSALQWLQSQASLQASQSCHPWLRRELADFSKLFLSGESAGANIALQIAMKASPLDLSPLRILGLLLIHPGFHSEANRQNMVDPELHDLQVHRLYDLALPEGQNLDYPPVNPLNPDGPSLSPLAAYPNILITAADKDFRYEMTLKFHEAVKGLSENVQIIVTEGKGHAFHVFERDCKETIEIENQLAEFMASCK